MTDLTALGEEEEYRPQHHLAKEMILWGHLAGRRTHHLRWGRRKGGSWDFIWTRGFPKTMPLVAFTLPTQRMNGMVRLLALDFDGKGLDAEADARACYRMLRAHGIVCIPVKSSSAGWHVLATVNEPYATALLAYQLGVQLRAQFPTLDLGPVNHVYDKGGAIRPPLSRSRRKPDGSKAAPDDPDTVWSELCCSLEEAILLASIGNPPEALQALSDALPAPPPPPPPRTGTRGRAPRQSAARSRRKPTPPVKPRPPSPAPADLTIEQMEARIGRRGYDVLHTGRKPGDSSRSAVIFAVCRYCRNAGLSLDRTFRLLQQPQHVTSSLLAERAAEHGRTPLAELEHDWGRLDKAKPTQLTYKRRHRELHPALLRLQDEIFTRGFGGRCGETDGRVLRALIYVARRANELEIDVSERELWEHAAPLSRNGIRAGLERLSDDSDPDRFLDLRWGEYGNTNRVTFRPRYGPPAPTTLPPPPPEHTYGADSRVQPRVEVDEAFRRRIGDNDAWEALPKRCHTVFSALRYRKPATPSELRAATGLGEDAVSRALSELKQYGLAVSPARGQWSAAVNRRELPAILARVAANEGTSGKRAKIRAQHAEDRLALQRRLEEIEEEKRPKPTIDPETDEPTGGLTFTLRQPSPRRKPSEQRRRAREPPDDQAAVEIGS